MKWIAFFSWHRNAFVTNVIANVQVHGDKEIRGKWLESPALRKAVSVLIWMLRFRCQ